MVFVSGCPLAVPPVKRVCQHGQQAHAHGCRAEIFGRPYLFAAKDQAFPCGQIEAETRNDATPAGLGPMAVGEQAGRSARKAKDFPNRQLSGFKAALNFAYRTEMCATDAAWRSVKPFKAVGRASYARRSVNGSWRLPRTTFPPSLRRYSLQPRVRAR